MKTIPDLIGASIPAFLVLLFLEIWICYKKGKDYYRLSDSLSNVSAGILQVVVGFFSFGIQFTIYSFVYLQFSVTSMGLEELGGQWFSGSGSGTGLVLAWFLAFLGVDLCYYWFHRSSHEVNLIWASHVVHHSSDEYNFSVALRQGAIQSWFSIWFFLPLAVLGVTPFMYFVLRQTTDLYQFWIHTRLIKFMWRPFEFVFNTPSHHRVHHGRNPQYIDKNHGGTLIIWDRLFGSFQKEEEAVEFGITNPLQNWNPLWAQFHHFSYLMKGFLAAPSIKEKLAFLFYGPGWSSGWLLKFKEKHPSYFVLPHSRLHSNLNVRQGGWLMTEFVLSVLLLALLVNPRFSWSVGWLILLAGTIFLLIVHMGWVLNSHISQIQKNR